MTIVDHILPDTLAVNGKDGNFRPYRHVPRPLAIVVHVTQANTAASTFAWFANPSSQVSANYLVDKDGTAYRLLPDTYAAFHAGITYPALQALRLTHPDWTWLNSGTDINDLTIGIEHVGQPNQPWTAAQAETSAGLIRQLTSQYQIPVDRQHIVLHHEIYAGHTCPGTSCDIEALVAAAKS